MAHRIGKAARLVLLICLVAAAAGFGCGRDNVTTIIQTDPSTQIMTNANLSYLKMSNGVLGPKFSSGTTEYSALFIGTDIVTVTPVTATYVATVMVNGIPVPSGSPSQDLQLNPGQNTITVTVIAADGSTTKTYTVTAIRLSQEAYVKASNTGASDYFGTSISLSGDTLAVGAFFEDSNAKGVDGDQTNNSAIQSGAVYVFTRASGTWIQQAYIKASNTAGNDYFGCSVSLSGDTLAVGAYGESSTATGVNGDQTNNGAGESGAVYVYTRTNGVWNQQAYLKASNAESGNRFGNSVSLSGDTLAVGANFAGGSGAVYVFTRASGTWSQQAYLKASNTEAGDQFGFSISLSGDTLAVGAYYEDSNATGVNGDQADNSAANSGAVYVFTRLNGAWTQQAYLKASNTEADDLFGKSVSLSGDTLAVGAYFEDSNATGVNGDQSDNSAVWSGAVYVFTRLNGVWIQQAYLKASNTGQNDAFGASVSLSGDTLAVGAPGEGSNATGVNGNQADNSAANSGAVYVFARTNGVWSQQAYLKASNTGPDGFGGSVSLAGDALAVGAVGEESNATGVDGNQADNSASGSGAVYVFQ